MVASGQTADFRMNMHGSFAGREGHPAFHSLSLLCVNEDRDGLADLCGLAFPGLVLGHGPSTKAQGRNADQEQTASAVTPFLIDMSFLPLLVVVSALVDFTSEASCKLACHATPLKRLVHCGTRR